jgi:hypothetical protein
MAAGLRNCLFLLVVFFVRLAALKAAVASASKTLGGTAVSFYFWHLFAPIIKNTKSLRYNPTRQNAWP